MQSVTARIRIFSVESAPTIAMTATASETEVNAMVKNLGLREDPVVLRASPIQDHIKFSVVKRPSNSCGVDGQIDRFGNFQPGLAACLDQIYLLQFVREEIKLIIFHSNSNHDPDQNPHISE